MDRVFDGKLKVVLMFWASWNEPCKVMMRPFWDLAVAKRKEAVFLRVDVDKFRDIVEQYQVEALPTFLLINGGVVKGRVVGAKVDELNTAIKARI
jgi:thioredoxin 1